MDAAGVSAARNEGIKAAKGFYLVFADSDDYCDENWIESLWNLHVSVKGRYIPVCGLTVVKDYIERVGENRNYSRKERQSKVDKKNFLSVYECWLVNPPWNKLYEKDIILREKIFMPCDMDLGEDLLFNLEYMDKSNKEGYIIDNRGLYYYVQNRDLSLSTRWRNDRFKIESMLNTKIREYCEKWDVVDYTILNKLIYYNYRDMMVRVKDFTTPMSCREKIRYNNEILSSSEFQEAIRQYKDEIEHLVWIAYKSRNYVVLQLIVMLEKCKESLRKRFKEKGNI